MREPKLGNPKATDSEGHRDEVKQLRVLSRNLLRLVGCEKRALASSTSHPRPQNQRSGNQKQQETTKHVTICNNCSPNRHRTALQKTHAPVTTTTTMGRWQQDYQRKKERTSNKVKKETNNVKKSKVVELREPTKRPTGREHRTIR